METAQQITAGFGQLVATGHVALLALELTLASVVAAWSVKTIASK